ncbi:DUF2488 family protein [Synechococcus sp. Tobar12-5m-g]|jgi:hypothetical protein|uniref:MgPME-cyclase complex family protein n=1 Tax=unclassified Synechococcus TaxID=2626047 RepID=UPI0020CF7883|nr:MULTISPECIES: MgPME-cyclase complex family protein [unclassified Synechococcus]MCP9773272.1 DUF2488 family protein [Synechococcus sp. Tobar12-5m-g]MCP9874327.1 DUF2488 family protein [Synechococcus sp. Cruz CV-v-12]
MSASSPTTYYFVAASEAFLTVEEPLEEVLRERVRNYGEVGKPIDFWLIHSPAFLAAAELQPVAGTVPRPAAAVVSTDPKFIDFLKLRLEFVAKGSFLAPSASIPDPLASDS